MTERIKHVECVGHPASGRFHLRTECGHTVPKAEIARSLTEVTCERCLRILDHIENLAREVEHNDA